MVNAKRRKAAQALATAVERDAAPKQIAVPAAKARASRTHRTRRAARRRAQSESFGAPKAIASKPEPKGGSWERIKAMLAAKGPMTSQDLIKSMRDLNPATIYLALKTARERGRITMVENPAGIGQLNNLVS